MIVALLRIPYQAALTHLHTRLRTEFRDLQPAHLIVFQLIAHPPAGSRLTELAEGAQMTKQGMGQLIDALERGGYVERTADPVDRRAKPISLTPRGWAVHERSGALVAELQAVWAHRLGEAKVNHLLSLLRELGEPLDSA